MRTAQLAATTALPGLLLKPGMIFADAGVTTLESLRARQQELLAGSQQLVMAADEAGRDLTADEQTQINDNAIEVERLDGQITAREQAALALGRQPGGGRRTVPEPTAANPRPGPRGIPATVRDGKNGFQSFGDFAQCVKAGAVGDITAQQKLSAAATTYGNEGTGADGGFVVPPDFRREIAQKVTGEASLLSRTDKLTTGSNSMVLPTDETTPWEDSDGIVSRWEGEAATLQESKPSLGTDQVRLSKLTTMVKVTDELLEDAALLDTYLRAKAPIKMNAKINTAIISGSGRGMPLGILKSPSLVSVAKETSQAADSILFENVTNMIARLYVNDPAAVVWLINQNTLPQLMRMKFDAAASSPVPVWLPANGLAGQRFSTLNGYPVVPVQACPKLGDQGDIILADMSQYMTASKGQDIRLDISIHLHFDQDITAYRFIMRLAGQPWWQNPITPQNASEALGSFIVIDDRP